LSGSAVNPHLGLSTFQHVDPSARVERSGGVTDLDAFKFIDPKVLPEAECMRIQTEVMARLSFHVREGNLSVDKSDHFLPLITQRFICDELVRSHLQRLEFTDDVFERLQVFVDSSIQH